MITKDFAILRFHHQQQSSFCHFFLLQEPFWIESSRINVMRACAE